MMKSTQMNAENPLKSFLFGVTLPITSLRVIFSSSTLLLWSVIPIAITIALYVLAFSGLKGLIGGALTHFVAAQGWNPEAWYFQAGNILLTVLIFVVAALSFSFAANLIALPFNDWLAEKAERFTSPVLAPVPNPSLRQRLRLISIDLMKTVFAAMLAVGDLILSWIPGINFLAAELAFLLICFQFISFAQTRRNQGVRDGFRFLFRNIAACTGFGMAFSVLFSIPIVSAFCLPLAVVGGTLLVARGSPEFALEERERQRLR